MATVRPRDAASLILIRRDGGMPRLLMGRRSDGHLFMPGKWVFPGGRIERGDYRATAAAELPDAVARDVAATARHNRQDGARLARALALAAVRETFEETGLILGRPSPASTRPAGSWGAFGATGHLPDLSGLAYIARAITPPGRSRRFDARFFVAGAQGLAAADPVDSRELHELDWFTPEAALALDLPSVTRAVIALVGAHLEGRPPATPPLWAWRGRMRREPD
jgi:8-oxo-dGTP pyrophosphatase MutT (NUDIX family)